MMSSRERYLMALHHAEPDCVPLDLRTGEIYRFPGEPWRRTSLDTLAAIQQLGGDPCLDIYLPEPAFHPEVQVRHGRAGRSEDGYPLIFTEYETPAGVLRQVVKETPDWRDERGHQLMCRRNTGDSVREDWEVHFFDDWNASRYVESPVKTMADIEKMKYLLCPVEGEPLARWREEARLLKRWAGEADVLLRARRTFGAEAGMWLMRFEDFLCATLQEPELVDAFCQLVSRWQIRLAELALDIGVDVLMHRGYYETPEYFTPESYERFCRPLIETLGRMTRQAGALFALQRSEGNTRQVELLRQMPIDILFDVEPGTGGEDMALLKRELAGKTTLWGGVDSTAVINRGSPAEIDRAVKEAVETCAPGGGFVIMPVVWVQADTPFSQVTAAIEAVKRHGCYRGKG